MSEQVKKSVPHFTPDSTSLYQSPNTLGCKVGALAEFLGADTETSDGHFASQNVASGINMRIRLRLGKLFLIRSSIDHAAFVSRMHVRYNGKQMHAGDGDGIIQAIRNSRLTHKDLPVVHTLPG